ncbi:MAG TPA: helicase, partial [Myxococcales bacterium]|nr:helicase [Myxococcales bacterium]
SSVDSDDVDAVRVLSASIRQFAADTEAVLALPSDEQDLSVRWVEVRARSVAMVARPLEVGPILERTLLAEPASRLFTSATVAIGDDFRSFIDSLGLAESTQTLRVPGTFDYPSQALLYVPSHLPEPFAPGREHAVATEIVRLIQASEGGAFALFSSYRAMQSSYYRAVDNLAGYQVFMQGQESRERLIERFRAEQPAVLFATMGFWQGVDLPGQVLRMVILDKVPFPPPDDPLFAARSARLKAAGQSSFARLSIPSATISLRQGFGRLIRSKEDRGVVSILDPRVRRRSYGRALLNALPPARKTEHFDDVTAFYSDLCD